MLARHPLAEPTFHRGREPQPRPFRNTNLAASAAQQGLFRTVLLQNNCGRGALYEAAQGV